MNLTPIVRKPMSEVLTPICPGCGQKRALGEFERIGEQSWCVACVKDALAVIVGSWMKEPKKTLDN